MHRAERDFDALGVLDSVQRRVLWLATRIIDHANRERPKTDGLKVGGHQASSASSVSLMTVLWLRFLGADDRVAVKPHASPVMHALWYLLGGLEPEYLTKLRSFHGLQAYPSRTKDPDRVDFSTGSMGMGAVAPLFAGVTSRYLAAKGWIPPGGRFVSLLGDAELDEGNVWEALADPVVDGVTNAVWVIDLNRQSLDRVVPGIKAERWKSTFRANGWNVIEAKYGARLRALFGQADGELLRAHIDAMSNETYQQLFTLGGADVRSAFLADADAAVKALVDPYSDDELRGLLTDLGGHDLTVLSDAYQSAWSCTDRPSVIFAYTVKGWSLPFAGDRLNHSALLGPEAIAELRAGLGLDDWSEWDRFPADSPEGQLCADAARRLDRAAIPAVPAIEVPRDLGISPRRSTSTQTAFGSMLARLADAGPLSDRIVTVAPDVAVSTNLAGWINKRGVFGAADAAQPPAATGLIQWAPGPAGQHIELGISEMNLFSMLGQLGLAYELSGELLLPIGTVYDPFVCRGLDAFIHAIYSGAKFILVGTPSGITLSPEGGAHQSTITPSIGTGLPDVDTVEPAYAKALEWMLCDALAQLTDRVAGRSTYFRLTTREIEQQPFEDARRAIGDDLLRRDVLAGAYLLRRARDTGTVVNIAATGAVLPEALAAAGELADEGIEVNLIDVTSADRLHRGWVDAVHWSTRRLRPAPGRVHLESLLDPAHRRAPLVTVQDATPHAMSWLGAALGARTVSLGVTEFGQSGTIPDLYEHHMLSADSIVNAAVVAVERG